MSSASIPDVTSRQLQTILALAEYESFIAAAALLKTSQPAVTRTVRHVEDVLGIKLFDRSTRSVQITAAGREFVGVAARILNDLKITIQSMHELSDQRRGQIIISCLMSVANGLPRPISTYRLNHPGIEIHVRDGVHGAVIEDVRSGTADFGISYLDNLPEPFTSVSLGREGFTVVLPRSHEFARKKHLSLPDLKDTPLVSLPTDTRTRRVVDGAASAVGLSLNHVITVSQFAAMLGFVRVGAGLAIAPRSGVQGLLGTDLVALPVRGQPLARHLGIIRLRQREPSAAASGLVELIQKTWIRSRY